MDSWRCLTSNSSSSVEEDTSTSKYHGHLHGLMIFCLLMRYIYRHIRCGFWAGGKLQMHLYAPKLWHSYQSICNRTWVVLHLDMTSLSEGKYNPASILA